jgi:hypothetical protein
MRLILPFHLQTITCKSKEAWRRVEIGRAKEATVVELNLISNEITECSERIGKLGHLLRVRHATGKLEVRSTIIIPGALFPLFFVTVRIAVFVNLVDIGRRR